MKLSNYLVFVVCCVPVVKFVFLLHPDWSILWLIPGTVLLMSFSGKSEILVSAYIRPICHSPLMEPYQDQWRFHLSKIAMVPYELKLYAKVKTW